MHVRHDVCGKAGSNVPATLPERHASARVECTWTAQQNKGCSVSYIRCESMLGGSVLPVLLASVLEDII